MPACLGAGVVVAFSGTAETITSSRSNQGLWRGCFFSCNSLLGMKTFSKVSREGCVSLARMVTHHVSPFEACAWGRLEARVTGDFLKVRTKGNGSWTGHQQLLGIFRGWEQCSWWAAAGRTWNFEVAVAQGTLLKVPIHAFFGIIKWTALILLRNLRTGQCFAFHRWKH